MKCFVNKIMDEITRNHQLAILLVEQRRLKGLAERFGANKIAKKKRIQKKYVS